ncbi:MAG: hypothetical protein AM326_01705 [Candidatus Thorarchaeota archaeon SMTZ-45]|nr:MAG: hypothetical protein AM326_01705 [Candidatus Thorarchaeota archaeon SMTZ-45]
MDLNYKDDLAIDKDSLEECLVEQPELYAKWSQVWAQAVRERDEAKEALNLVKAELDMKIRKSWDILGFDKKPTDMAITTWICAQKDYRDANFILIQATYNVNVLEAAKWAFQHRKDALDNLTKLFLSNYYADSKAVGKETRDMLDDMRQKKHEAVLDNNPRAIKLKRRKQE